MPPRWALRTHLTVTPGSRATVGCGRISLQGTGTGAPVRKKDRVPITLRRDDERG